MMMVMGSYFIILWIKQARKRGQCTIKPKFNKKFALCADPL